MGCPGIGKVVFWAIQFLVLCPIAIAHTEDPEQRHDHKVLLLHSYHEGLSWTDGQDDGIRETLATHGGIDISTEYLDSKRIPLEEISETFCNFLTSKYTGRQFDAVIVTDNSALTFLHTFHEEVFPGTPVVFSGVNNFVPAMLEGLGGLGTGVVQTLDPKRTVELILALQPQLGRLVLVSGTTPTAQSIRQEAEAVLKQWETPLEVRVLEGLSTQGLLGKLRALSRRDAVLLCNFNRDADGVYYAHEESAEMIARASSAPVYAMEDNYLGTGIVGGCMLSAREEGRVAGRMCVEVLKTGEIPPIVLKTRNETMVDYAALRRFGLSESRLPAYAILTKRPTGFYEENKWLIWNTVIIFTLMALGILALSYGLIRSRRAEDALKWSLERHRTLVENIPGVSYRCAFDHEWTMEFISNEIETLSGYPAEGFLQNRDRSYVSMIHPEDKEEALRSVDRAVESRTPFSIEYRIRRKDGTERWVFEKGQGVFGAEGEVVCVDGVVVDISHRKEVEEQLVSLRNYLTNIINSMPSVLVGVDERFRVTQWNSEAQRVTKVSCENALGRSLEEVFPRLSVELPRVQEAMRTGHTVTDGKVMRREGEHIYFEDVVIYPLVSNGVSGAVIRLDDVTERVRIEEMMVQNEKMMSVGGLAAGMAHEINNPLAGILQNMQVIQNRFSREITKNGDVAEECGTSIDALQAYLDSRGVRHMMQSVIDSGKRAAKIVENMLSFSRQSTSAHIPHDIRELVDTVVELARNDYDLKKKYDFRDVEIQREYDETMGKVYCSESKIQQVILNLLKNGAEAMSSAQVANPRFIIRVRAEGPMARIEIEDNGPGMDEETRKRVFEPFFTTKGDGTGLGLSVSYFIITEDHGGKMSVESAPGEGTAFAILLPFSEKRGQSAPRQSKDASA